MNEIHLLRAQLATERAHASAVANACASVFGRSPGPPPGDAPLAHFLRASVDYLVCVLAWFEERDQRLSDLARASAEAPVRRALDEALARPGRSREALGKLEEACTASASGDAAERRWQEFAQHFNGAWTARRNALDALLAANSRPSDWRAVSAVDADSILEERRRYALVCSRLPPGATLAAPPTPGS
jgi:hypothetical protein